MLLQEYITDIATGPFGSNLKVSCFVEKGFPIIDGANLKGYKVTDNITKFVTEEKARSLHRSIAKRGDIVVTISGNVGQISYIPDNSEFEEYLVSQRQFRATFDRNKVNVAYLVYYFHTREGQHKILSFANQVGVPALAQPLKNFKNINIELPSKEKQDAIAAYIDNIEDKIAINRRICKNLEAQAQALFKHWFIDFAPFKDGKFVESDLGIIPEGWRVVSLEEYVDNLGGYSYSSSELQSSKTAMATIKNFIRGGGFKIEGYKEIVISKKIKDFQYVNLFDVLVAHTDLTQKAEVVGNPAIILSTADYEKLIMSMDLTKVVPKDERITTPLLHCILSTKKFKEHAMGYVNGTTVLHMSKKAVPEYKLVMPENLDVLKDLTSILDDLYHLMSKTYAENIRLTILRDTLLPKLMTGQIKL